MRGLRRPSAWRTVAETPRLARGARPIRTLVLALVLAGCGNASNDRSEREPPAGEASTPREHPSEETDRSERLSLDRLTGEYLAGTWCFARPDGEGERGIYVFEPDGSYRATVAGFAQEIPGGLEDFRERYDDLVEMGADRFVVKGGFYEYVFRRGDCP